MLPRTRIETLLPTSLPTRRGIEAVGRYATAIKGGVHPMRERGLDLSGALVTGAAWDTTDRVWVASGAAELAVDLPVYVGDRIMQIGAWVIADADSDVTITLERVWHPGASISTYAAALDLAVGAPVVDQPHAHTTTATGAWRLELLGTPYRPPHYGLPADGVAVAWLELWRLVVATEASGARIGGGVLVLDHRAVTS
jgi:hypothetical protein